MTDGQTALVLCRPPEDETDRQLLERFAGQREEVAFATLVERYGAGVLKVCRRVLHQEQDAEDVAQATFLLLARKASVIRWQCSVERWLRAVAYRLALKARSSAARRRLRETPIGSLAPINQGDADAVSGSAWGRLPEKSHPAADCLEEVGRRELHRVIADELNNLPQKYHAPVVLCYLEGKTNEEAAGQLGWPLGSMSGRLARARALLQQRLLRRGLALLLLVGLAGLPFALGWRPSTVQTAHPEMPAGVQAIENDLRHLVENPQPAERQRLVALARQTALVANAIEQHGPSDRRDQWQTFSQQMRASALELAAVLEAREDKASVLAARALAASCQKCHVAFRD